MKTKTATSAQKMTAKEATYKQHTPGRRQGKVYELFDKEGAEAAWTLGRKLKLKENTLRSWFARWKCPDTRAISRQVAKKSSVHPQTNKRRPETEMPRAKV